jgi:hypothetical protein
MSADQKTLAEADDQIRRDQLRRNLEAIRLLDEWEREGDEQEQQESLAYLKQVIDEHRPGQRKQFP